jgi:hypothetical protein
MLFRVAVGELVFCIKLVLWFFIIKRVPGRGPEQRQYEKTVLYPQIIKILISYIIKYYY